MGFTSAALRRWISGGGGAAKILRSNRIPTFSFTAKRMITSTTTTGGVSFFESAKSPSPFLLLSPPADGPTRSITRLYSPATNEIYNFCTEEYCRRITGCGWGILGTSHGWLGFYNSDNHDVLLLDPVTDRNVRLPSMDCAVHALIFVEKTRFAVAAAGSGGRLALCRNGVWTSFPSDKACDSLSYSSRRNRLFCITRDANNKSNLEVWNLGEREGDTPKCEWEMDLNVKSSSRNSNNLKKLKYIACAEHSGEVFVVVRHVRIRHGFYGSFVDGIVSTEYVGDDSVGDPYKTDHFKVYKVDEEGRRLILMKDSLEGMAMFVGANHPMAIPAKEVAGVKPDSVYFTYDRRIRYWFRRYRDDENGLYRYGGYDNGVYDYIKMKFSPVFTHNRVHDRPHKPLWFTSPHI